MKKIITLIISLFFPPFLKPVFYNILGHSVHRTARIYCSYIYTDHLVLGESSRISFLNVIYNTRIEMGSRSYIGLFNVFNGPYTLVLHERAAIGKGNKCARGKIGVTYGLAKLELGILTKITAHHHIDVTCSIVFGDYSILAGVRSQLWTHGYVHASAGPERFRVDGEINIGHNVYLGSGVLINPGVHIADTIHVGGNATISKDLTVPGMYVSQPLRHLDKSFESIKTSLRRIEVQGLIEDVYGK